MKKDTQVTFLIQERRKGTPQKLAAAPPGMSQRTARKYEQAGQLPSQLKGPHSWATRNNPFEQHWSWVVAQLEHDRALQGSTLFALLWEQHPACSRPTQIRTFQRHIARWPAMDGPEQQVIFEQRHQPGERAQSDFTPMQDLGVTIAGQPLPHMVYHFVLTYSNPEAVSLCFSETLEALGIEKALWLVGGGPEQHPTEHLRAAVRQLPKEQREDWTVPYQALMADYRMQPTCNNQGLAHENGDVEQSHYRFKQAVDQALRASWCRDFSTRAPYEHFLQDLVSKGNQTPDAPFTAQKEGLRPLPAASLSPCKELRVTGSRFSRIHGNSSLPSPLIGSSVMVGVRAETLEGDVGTSLVFLLAPLVGKHKHRIEYRHVIWSLVPKPAALAASQYRDERFATTTLRLA